MNKFEPTDTLTFEEVAALSLRHLTSTPQSPFLYKGHTKEFESRFVHERAKNGARFTDGNNGDFWRVIVSEAEHCRLVVQNLSQDFITIMYWDEPYYQFTPLADVTSRQQARDIAIDWQAAKADEDMSWHEVAWAGRYFEELAKRYRLKSEFKENGIL